MQEKRFTKAVGEMIALRFIEDWATSDDDGIRVKPGVEENDPALVLSWTPACEMEGWPDSPEASTYPALPYPFTAKELAAFLLSGAGSMVAEDYGDFSDGPYEVRLQALGAKAGHARDALRQAYTEIRRAIAEVGEVDQQLQQKAHALRHQFDEANSEANRREGLWEAKKVDKFWEPGISEDERRVRRERARQSVEELKVEMDSVGRDADSALKNWNAAMVKALLYPAPELTDAAAPPEAVLMPAQAVPVVAESAPSLNHCLSTSEAESVVDNTSPEALQPVTVAQIETPMVAEQSAPAVVGDTSTEAPQPAPAAPPEAVLMPMQTQQIPQDTPAPELTPATPAHVVKTQTKRRTWREVSVHYIVEVMQAGQYATAKELYRALEAKAGPNSPFDKGTGDNRGSLFVREVAQSLKLKTVQNEWSNLVIQARK